MVNTCVVDGCNERYRKGGTTTFHSFPKDPTRRKLWLIAIRKEECMSNDLGRVCSKHFTKKDYNRKKFGGTWLKPNAVPNLFNFSTNPTRSLLFPLDINLSDEESSSSSFNSPSSPSFNCPSSNSPSSPVSERAFEEIRTVPSVSSSPVSERAVVIEDIRTLPSSSILPSSLVSERAASSEESTSNSSAFQSLLTPIERNSSTEELFRSGASVLGTASSKRTSLFRLAKRCGPSKVKIKDSSIVTRIKENDTKHIRYLQFLANSLKDDIDDDISLSSSIRWAIARQQKDLERRSEVAQKEKKRLRRSLKLVRQKIRYMRQLNASLKARLDKSTH